MQDFLRTRRTALSRWLLARLRNLCLSPSLAWVDLLLRSKLLPETIQQSRFFVQKLHVDGNQYLDGRWYNKTCVIYRSRSHSSAVITTRIWRTVFTILLDFVCFILNQQDVSMFRSQIPFSIVSVWAHLIGHVVQPLFPPRTVDKVPKLANAITTFHFTPQPVFNKFSLFYSRGGSQTKNDMTQLQHTVRHG